MGARFEALDEGVLMAPLDPRYTHVAFNSISVQVCGRDKRSLLEFAVHLEGEQTSGGLWANPWVNMWANLWANLG